MRRPGNLRLFTILVTAIAAVSCGSIFVRMASGSVPALAIAAYRVTWASVLIAPFLTGGAGREITSTGVRQWRSLTLSGVALAMHFALWIASLDYTSVASSVLLVDTTPFFIGLATTFVLRQPAGRPFWTGLTIAFVGCAIIFRGDFAGSSATVKGNALALGGAIAMAVYLLVGAQARRKLSLVAYVWPVYLSAAVVLAVACLIARVPLRGFPKSAHMFMFLLGLVPQCVGHTGFNWALRWLSPGMVSLVALTEPVGASLLARIFLGERLSAEKIFGGAVILVGIYTATREAGKGRATT